MGLKDNVSLTLSVAMLAWTSPLSQGQGLLNNYVTLSCLYAKFRWLISHVNLVSRLYQLTFSAEGTRRYPCGCSVIFTLLIPRGGGKSGILCDSLNSLLKRERYFCCNKMVAGDVAYVQMLVERPGNCRQV